MSKKYWLIPPSRRVSRNRGSWVLGVQAPTTTRFSPLSRMVSAICWAASVAHEYTNPRLLFSDVPLVRIHPILGQFAPPLVEEFATEGFRSAGSHYRLGDIHRSLEGSAHEDPRA